MANQEKSSYVEWHATLLWALNCGQRWRITGDEVLQLAIRAIMKNVARILTYALFTGVLIGVAAPLLAQEQPKHSEHATFDYNAEVVKKLLEESDPDVAFLARLKMMQGHLNAAIYAAGNGDLAEARQHIEHPAMEILPDIVSVLRKRNLKDPTPALNHILDLLRDGTKEEIETALYDAVVEIAELEHSIDPAKIVIDGIVADTAVLLLRTAVIEYDEAFKNGDIVEIVEYHDGAEFVSEAATLIRDAKYEWISQNSAAYDKLELSLMELQTAWPSKIPPPKSVIPLTEMLALVTTIELQVNTIRAGC
jgi:hypothetical protein